MGLDPHEIEQIKNRSPGWEAAWNKLWAELAEALPEAIRGLPIRWPASDSPEDFRSHLLLDYRRKAEKKILLRGYDPARGDPVRYLLSRGYLYRRAIDYLTRESQHAGPRFERVDEEGNNEVPEPEGPGQPPDGLQELAAKVARELESLTVGVPGEGAIRQEHVTAGLELEPRIDWTKAGLRPLRSHVLGAVAGAATDEDRRSYLQKSHEDATAAIEAELRDLGRRLLDHEQKGTEPQVERKLRNRQLELWARQVFSPLAAEDLQGLTGITRATADQWLSRYRRRLPELLPELSRLYGAIRRLRESGWADELEEDDEEEEEV